MVSVLLRRCLLIVNFGIFAMITTTGGVAMLEAIAQYHVSHTMASYVEFFRDGSNLLISCIIFSFLAKFGYRRSLIIGLLIMFFGCLLFPVVNNFLGMSILFAAAGAVFAVTKICIYVLVAEVTHGEKEHASFLSLLEGAYMIASLIGFWLFSWFLRSVGGKDWLHVYWVFAVLTLFIAFWWLVTPIDESIVRNQKTTLKREYKSIFTLLIKRAAIISLIVLCLYVYIENSFNCWLPSFNHETLHISKSLSVAIASILTAAIAFGRLVGSIVLKYLKWYKFIILTGLCAILLLLLSFWLLKSDAFLTYTQLSDIPLAAYLLPLVGFFLGPIYPTLASVALQSTDPKKSGAMMTLIMIVSAIGGIAGTRVIGILFGHFDGFFALGSLMIPMIVLISLMPFYAIEHYKDLREEK